MSILLVFPPPASPTYVPLGISSLYSYIKKFFPDVSIQLWDFNIETWEWKNQNEDENQDWVLFMQGKKNFFYNPSEYEIHLPAFHKNYRWFDLKIQEIKTALEEGEVASSLESYLNFFISRFVSFNVSWIGFSVMFPKQLFFALILSKYIKIAFPRKKICLGGAGISAFQSNELLENFSFIDGLFRGEGEESLRKCLQKNDFDGVPGFIYRKNGKIIHNAKPDTLSFSFLPAPDFSRFDLNRYYNPTPVLSVLLSRGCKWRKCRFCCHNLSFSGYRKKRISSFIEELKYFYHTYKVNHFYFADQYLDVPDLIEIAKGIIESRLKIFFHFMGRPTGDFTLDVFHLLFQAGCRWISWGVETGAQRLLDLVQKGTEISEILRVIKDSHFAGVSNLVMLIFGLPSSSDKELKETFNAMDQVMGETDAFTCSSFQLFEKTAFASNPNNYNIKITGKEIVLNIGAKSIHSSRLFFERTDTNSNRGSYEIGQWLLRRKWIKEQTFFEKLNSEHYLLFASHLKKGNKRFPISA